MITLFKNYSDINKNQRKINVKKIISLKEVLNKPIEELKIQVNNIDDLNKLKSLSREEGMTKIIVDFIDSEKTYQFQLKDKRKLDPDLINSLKIGKKIIIH